MVRLSPTPALGTDQDSEMPDCTTRPSSRRAARPQYELKPNSSRRTNTARVSALPAPPVIVPAPTVPPPAYMVGDRDVDPPPYTAQGDGAQDNTGIHQDLEAGVAQRTPQQERPRQANAPAGRQRSKAGGVIAAIFMSFLIIMAVKYWRP